LFSSDGTPLSRLEARTVDSSHPSVVVSPSSPPVCTSSRLRTGLRRPTALVSPFLLDKLARMDSPINNFNMPSWYDTGDDNEPAGPPHSSNAVASTSRYPYEATGAWAGAPAGVHSEGSFGPAFARGAGGTASLDTEDCDGAGSFDAGKAPGGQTPGVSQFRISVGAPTSPHPPTVVSAAAGGHRATITPITINPYALPPVHSFLPLLRDGHSPSFDTHAQSPVRSPAVVASRGTTSSSSEDGHPDVRSSNPAALVSTTLWEDEATVCFQVLVQGHTVARRAGESQEFILRRPDCQLTFSTKTTTRSIAPSC
jgi:hypothetical protein